MLDHSCQVQRHPHAERGYDLYGTPAVAIEALLAVETTLPRRIWEPAVGRGAIAEVFTAAAYDVVGTDLVDYGIGYSGGIDFLMERKLPEGCEAIVTNPPFKIADQFVAHALELCPRVVMLLRLAFLESSRRTPILENRGLARVHVFRRRLPFMHRDGWAGSKASSAIGFGWYVYDRAHIGPPVLNRIDWNHNRGEAA
jgi:hypothetical protein